MIAVTQALSEVKSGQLDLSRAEKIAEARRKAIALQNHPRYNPKTIPEFGKLTVAQLENHGVGTKSGYLMKQSGVLGM
jgi:hypothetical protein